MAWPRSTILLLLAAAGCRGQNVEGAWRGPFPLAGAKECELRLLNDRTATIQCDGTAIVAGGVYHWDGEKLEVAFRASTREGARVAGPDPFVFKVQGQGNVLKAVYRGEVYEWQRYLK